MRRAAPADAGFSLLELVAVMAIFALVATMSVQVLQGTLRSQSRLGAQAKLNANLSLALARLRMDLESTVALAFRGVDGVEAPALVIDNDAGQMAMSVGGSARFAEEQSAGLGRIEWRLDPQSGQIMRRYWPTLTPGRESASNSGIPVMDGVRALEFWTYGRETGWVAGWTPDPDDAASLPLAIRVVIVTGALGRLELVERL